MSPATLLAPLLAAALLAGGCDCAGREPMPVGPVELTPPPGGWDYELELGREGPLRGKVRGVRLEIERSLALEAGGLGKANVTGFTKRGIGDPDLKIHGQALQIAGQRLRIGDTVYGEVGSGDRVVVSPEGVRVDGELRGPLPGS